MRPIRLLTVLLAITFALSACQQSQGDGDGPPENGARLFHVTETGVSGTQGEALRNILGAAVNVNEAGVATFVDPELHLRAPMRETDPLDVPPDEDREEPREVSEVLDRAAIAELEAPSDNHARARFRDALEGSNLFPDDSLSPDPANMIGTGRTTLSIRGRDGSEMASGTLHTRAGLAPELNGHPYVGPGATAVASFANVDGEMRTTSLRYAWRNVEQGEWVELLDSDQVRERCLDRLRGDSEFSAEEIELDEPHLVYYAPSLENPAAGEDGPREVPVETIAPHFTCGGTATLEGGETAELAQAFIPATDEPAYDPEVELNAELEGETVTASVDIAGGHSPYTVEWQSTHNDLDPAEFGGSEIAYDLTLDPKNDQVPEETVSVTVYDANGLKATAAETIDLSGASLRASPSVQPAVGGITDFGSESVANKGWGKGTNDKFERVLRNAGVTERFVWDGVMGWERDFHAPHDATWADNADVTFLSGHGWPGGISFVDNDHDDGYLRRGGEAHGDWGDKDLEWLTFGSCNVLQTNFNSSGTDVVQRWGDEFDGLHTLLGFHTLMQLWDSLGEEYAQALTGDAFPLVNVDLTVVQSWFLAIQRSQSFREGVAMGPIREDGVSNYDDYFWGHGSVGPDIPQDRIEAFWVVSESSWVHYNF